MITHVISSMYIYIYVHVYVYIYIYIYIHIYIFVRVNINEYLQTLSNVYVKFIKLGICVSRISFFLKNRVANDDLFVK